MSSRIYPTGRDPASREASKTLQFVGLIAAICCIATGVCLYQVGTTGDPAAALTAILSFLAFLVSCATWISLWTEAHRD